MVRQGIIQNEFVSPLKRECWGELVVAGRAALVIRLFCRTPFGLLDNRWIRPIVNIVNTKDMVESLHTRHFI